MGLVVSGMLNKQVASGRSEDQSEVTVKMERGRVMRKYGGGQSLAGPRPEWAERLPSGGARHTKGVIADRPPVGPDTLAVDAQSIPLRLRSVDDDELMRGALLGLLKAAGLSARTFASGREEFLATGGTRRAVAA